MKKVLKYLIIFIIVIFILPAVLTKTTKQVVSYQNDNVEEKVVEEKTRK